MEFHVWDFRPEVEVRLSDDVIKKIRGMTKPRALTIRDKSPRVGWRNCGWKSPKQREPFTMVKDVKLIPFTAGSPYYKIAERLYMKVDRHGRGRKDVPHKPYISVEDLRTVQKVTGISRHELESDILSVRNRYSNLELKLKFPILADASWAWLFGYYFSCGSLVTRDRFSRIGNRQEERIIRLVVERQVFERQLLPLLTRIGYRPELKSLWYEKYGSHKVDQQKKIGAGNRPRKIVFLPRIIREVMEYFGLFHDVPKEGNHGRTNTCRTFKLKLPTWIRGFPREFIEGFINGGQVGSVFNNRSKGILRTVELRVGFRDPADTIRLITFLGKQLRKLGITGSVYRIRHRTSERIYWLRFSIFRCRSLANLFQYFDIQNPLLRSRLSLNFFMNQLLYQVCKKLHNVELLLLGAMMEGPKTAEELVMMFRLRDDQVADGLRILDATEFVREEHGRWRVIPTGIKNRILRDLRKEDEQRRRTVMVLNEAFFSCCNSCGNVIPHNYQGACGCGGMYHPVERSKVLRSYRTRNGPKIARIMEEEIPVRGG